MKTKKISRGEMGQNACVRDPAADPPPPLHGKECGGDWRQRSWESSVAAKSAELDENKGVRCAH